MVVKSAAVSVERNLGVLGSALRPKWNTVCIQFVVVVADQLHYSCGGCVSDCYWCHLRSFLCRLWMLFCGLLPEALFAILVAPRLPKWEACGSNFFYLLFCISHMSLFGWLVFEHNWIYPRDSHLDPPSTHPPHTWLLSFSVLNKIEHDNFCKYFVLSFILD